MESKSLPRSTPVKIQFDGGEADGVVKKIALGDFAKLASMIDDLMASGANVGDLTTTDGTKAMIEIMKIAPDKIADIVALVSSFTKEQILLADMESVFDVLTEAWKLNNLVKMFSGALKKAMGAQDAPQTQETQALGSIEQ